MQELKLSVCQERVVHEIETNRQICIGHATLYLQLRQCTLLDAHSSGRIWQTIMTNQEFSLDAQLRIHALEVHDSFGVQMDPRMRVMLVFQVAVLRLMKDYLNLLSNNSQYAWQLHVCMDDCVFNHQIPLTTLIKKSQSNVGQNLVH